jgi:hypothetical protein
MKRCKAQADECSPGPLGDDNDIIAVQPHCGLGSNRDNHVDRRPSRKPEDILDQSAIVDRIGSYDE